MSCKISCQTGEGLGEKNNNLFIILEILRQWTELGSFLPLGTYCDFVRWSGKSYQATNILDTSVRNSEFLVEDLALSFE